ncbi:MAG TPA: 30S ribosomal protein S18 [Candidatus Acidoferrales bacterium]|nr:30S ribosomal protein S18 [Candidatus Acidoferrales bacterium]
MADDTQKDSQSQNTQAASEQKPARPPEPHRAPDAAPTDSKPPDARPPEPRPPDARPHEPRSHEGRPHDGRPRPEGRPGEGRGPREGGREGGKRGRRGFYRKKKVCRFCVDRVDLIDYKKPEQLMSFIQERGKIVPRRISGTCSRHQRWLAEAIKRARNIALMPFGGAR